jgi:tetratricopeptide (TPR) repeat protein
MAQSALKQGLYEDALGLLQDAQRLLPEDAELKATVQNVIREYAKGSAPRKPAVAKPAPASVEAKPTAPAAAPEAPAPMTAQAPAPAQVPSGVKAESVEDVERRIRAQVESEYKQRADTSRTPAAPVDLARQHVLAQAGAPDDEPVSSTMADLYLKQGHFTEALRIFEALLKREPNNAEYLRKTGEIRMRLGSPAVPPPVQAAPPPLPPVVPMRREPEPVAVASSAQAEPVARARPRVSYV